MLGPQFGESRREELGSSLESFNFSTQGELDDLLSFHTDDAKILKYIIKSSLI